jgi:C4-dicarboxylate-specific signal transduction histidine kinase
MAHAHRQSVSTQRSAPLLQPQVKPLRGVEPWRADLHDLSNLLQVVSCLVRTCDRLHPQPAEGQVRQMLEQAYAALGRASDVARKLHHYDAWPGEAPGSSDVGSALARAQWHAQMLAPAGVTVQLVAQHDLGVVQCERGELDRALLNLVLNALAAVGEQGTIWIVGERDGPRARLFVEDDGPGMTPEAVQSVLAQARRADGRNPRGGLAAVAALAHQLSGSFVLESRDAVGTRAALLTPAACR